MSIWGKVGVMDTESSITAIIATTNTTTATATEYFQLLFNRRSFAKLLHVLNIEPFG